MCFCIGFVVESVECGWSKLSLEKLPPGKEEKHSIRTFLTKKKRMGKKFFRSEENNV